MLKNKYDTIIIGSGVGGTASAALMSSLGHSTLLLEKNLVSGGRAATYDRDGFKFDHGHIVMRSEKGPHGEVLRLAKRKDLIPQFSHCGNWPMKSLICGAKYDFLPTVWTSFLFPWSYLQARKFEFTWKDRMMLPVFAAILRFNTQKQLDRLNYECLEDYLYKFTSNKYFHAFFGGLASVSFGATLKDASAGELLRVIQYGLKEWVAMGYPVNGEGIAAIPNSFLKSAQDAGCEFHTNTPVEKIIIEKGKVTGVRVNGENIWAKNVISSIGIKETIFKLAGEEHFDRSYSDRILNLKYSYGGMSLKYALKKKITKFNWGGDIPDRLNEVTDDMIAGRIPHRFPIMFVATSNIDPRLAPPGKQAMSFISGGPAAKPGEIDWDQWVDHMKAQAEELFPGLKENTLHCDVTTPDQIAHFTGRTFGDAVGVSQNIHQVGDRRPSPISPIKGLYYAGADVGRGNCATELASESAIALFKHFKKQR